MSNALVVSCVVVLLVALSYVLILLLGIRLGGGLHGRPKAKDTRVLRVAKNPAPENLGPPPAAPYPPPLPPTRCPRCSNVHSLDRRMFASHSIDCGYRPGMPPSHVAYVHPLT